jgi:hypothetical protein
LPAACCSIRQRERITRLRRRPASATLSLPAPGLAVPIPAICRLPAACCRCRACCVLGSRRTTHRRRPSGNAVREAHRREATKYARAARTGKALPMRSSARPVRGAGERRAAAHAPAADGAAAQRCHRAATTSAPRPISTCATCPRTWRLARRDLSRPAGRVEPAEHRRHHAAQRPARGAARRRPAGLPRPARHRAQGRRHRSPDLPAAHPRRQGGKIWKISNASVAEIPRSGRTSATARSRCGCSATSRLPFAGWRAGS